MIFLSRHLHSLLLGGKSQHKKLEHICDLSRVGVQLLCLGSAQTGGPLMFRFPGAKIRAVCGGQQDIPDLVVSFISPAAYESTTKGNFGQT